MTTTTTFQHQTGTAAPGDFEGDARIESKTTLADGIVALTLREAHGRAFPPWTPGAHIDLRPAGAPTRQYSLCGDPADRDRWRVAVLREPDGRGGSRHVHDRLAVGDVVAVRGPRNHFPLARAERYLFIAGGIGITPMLAMVAAADAAGAEWRLVYTGRRRAAMAFLDDLAAYGDRVVLHPRDETGRPDLDALLAVPRPGTLVYCCGPEPLLTAVRQKCAGWPPSALRMEHFAAERAVEPVEDRPFEVRLARSGRTLTAPPGRSLLSVLTEAGVAVVSACAEGVCGTCETTVLEGRPEHRDSVLTDEERCADDRMMVCVSRSRTARLVLDL